MGRSILSEVTSTNSQDYYLAGIGSSAVIWTLTGETTFVSNTAANGGTARPTHLQMSRRSIESNCRLLKISIVSDNYIGNG